MSEAALFRTSRASRPERIVNRLLWGVIALLILFIFAELFFHFVLAPRLTIRNIVVHSDLPLTREEVLSIAGIEEKEYYFSLNVEEIRSALAEYPLIEKAVVEKFFPDTLKMILYKREPLVMALVNTPKKTVPVAIDREGVMFQIGTGISDWDLPVLSGIEFRGLKAGVRLPEMIHPLLSDLQGLRADHQALYRLISEIKILPKAGSGYELELWTLSAPIKIRLGGELGASSVKNAVLILDLIKGQEMVDKVEELDLRSGEVVYRMKEGVTLGRE